DNFATGLTVMGTAADATSTWFWPRLTADGSTKTWDVVADVCARVHDGKTGHIDDKVVDVAVARAGATATKFRAVYVSRFSTAFDETCALRLGDPEVMGLDVDTDHKTIYDVSNNQASLTDIPRGGGPCKL